MARDHYEVLGVSPTSEDVVIRAAYRALMRRYHPDKDPGAELSGRALEINAAYAVLGDPGRRARYDGSLAAAGMIKPNAGPRRALAISAVPRPRPGAIAAFVAVAGLLLILALSPPLAQMPGAPAVLGRGAPAPLAAGAEPMRGPAAGAQAAAAACNGDFAAVLVKQELFRRAAILGGRDGARFGAAAGRSLIRLQSEPAAAGPGGRAARCSGWLALDLPPGLVVDGGRSNLNSEVHYAFAGRAGGQLRLADLSGADALVASLATLARAAPAQDAADAAPAAAPVAAIVADALPATARERPAEPARQVAAKAPARPKPGCRYSSRRTEQAICGSSNLAALDRSLDMFYAQSLARADDARKAALVSSSGSFASRRDACRSQSCLTSAYLARMREVSAIMAKTPQP